MAVTPSEPPSVDEREAQIAKLTDLAARAQADLQNFKMRMEREAQDLRTFAMVPLLLKLLPIRDDLARAGVHTQGLQQILEKFDKVLSEVGVVKMDVLGKPFDPKKHEVLNTAAGEKDRILAVHEEGYELSGRVLRPAKVQVGDGAPPMAEAGEEGTASALPSEEIE